LLQKWWRLCRAADAAALVEAQRGQALSPLDRLLYLGARTSTMNSLEQVCDQTGRASDLKFTDVALAWSRSEQPFRGDERMLDAIAGALPELRTLGA
jgi:hypothetical protein